jgi:hypothetical protein
MRLCVCTAAAAVLVLAPRVGTHGVTVVLPPGWHSWNPVEVVAPAVTDPRTRLVVASRPLRYGKGCGELDWHFRADGVALVILEWRDHGLHMPPRPARFTARNLPVHRPPILECWNGPGGAVQFRDHGRYFGVYLLVGREASQRAIARARRVLDTLRVS